MHRSNSNLSHGTLRSPQQSLEQEEYGIAIKENEQKALQHQYHLTYELPKSCPIEIPDTDSIKEENKQGYTQVKYSWKDDQYQYTSRWHTKTPNAPSYQGNSWVIERKIPGIGYGSNPRKAKKEILVKDTTTNNNKWIDKKLWDQAINARKNGTITKEQKEILDNGHFKD